MSTFLRRFFFLCVLCPSWIASIAAQPRPSIVVILTDDQGRGDYSAFGTKDIRTPHMDRLFRDGMTFQNFYANSCVCSPSRTRYSSRARRVPSDSALNWASIVAGALGLLVIIAA